ncbi:hypothetical protein [Streptomyces specialis]|uniref:hypothetical protein n=1 Tax=Streptomyces specialis TaxID=498367 RepID=UPI000ACC17F9|nr:hypothetical protein [Streptomyces specialis]
MSKNDTFSITLESGEIPRDATGLTEGSGTIRIGDFSESFLASLSFWSVDDYVRSWREAFEVLSSDDNATSCLVTSITDPEDSNFIFCWPLYRAGEVVHVHNSVIFLDELDEAFDADAPWKSVRPRTTVSEDGRRISEWETTITALRRFFSSLSRT